MAKKLRKGTTYFGKDTAAARKASADLNAKGRERAEQDRKDQRKAYYTIQEIRKREAMRGTDE